MNKLGWCKILGVFLMLGFAIQLNAQDKGLVRGTITDKASGEPLMFTNVYLKSNPGKGAQTDLDGKYELALDPGTYDLEVSYIGYATNTITGVEVKAGEVTILNFFMEDETATLVEVTVSAEKIQRSENALLMLQKKASGIQDGISAQEISRYGSNNAAESMKRITGASVVDGKYIFVRGLGDRYTSAQLNGQTLPSTNPYRNSSQLDLIPSNLLDNVIASKSFTPNLPGSFTGGNVNIKTKSFPEEFTLSFNASMSYNSITTGNNNFLTYEGGNTDWLGYDDGTRALPDILSDPAVREDLTTSMYLRARRNAETASLLNESSQSVSNQMTPTTTTAPVNHNIGFSVGNQFQLGKNPLGVLLGLNYRRSFSLFDNGSIRNFELPGANAEALNGNFDLQQNRSVDNPSVGGLLNLAYKFGGSNKINFNFLYNHDAEKGATTLVGPNPGIISGGFIFETRSLSWTEREMTSYQVNGEHTFGGSQKKGSGVKLEWGGSYVRTTQDEPDLRFFANTFDQNVPLGEDGRFLITPSEYDLPFHFWRELADEQYLGKVDLTIPFAQSVSRANKFQFGALYQTKERTFGEDRFQYQDKSGDFMRYAEDPTSFFAPANVGIIGEDNRGRNVTGLYITDETRPENSYTGQEDIAAYYGMVTYDLNRFKIIAGARIEQTDLEVVAVDTTGSIDETTFLPSLNFVYRLNEDNMNLRASYSQTLARPNMREMAPFASFEFIGGFIYTGNPALELTTVQNYDLRWEWFPSPGELVSTSVYYKNFTNPIISRFLPESQNPEIKFDNVDEAIVYGVEFEFRKKLDFLGSFFRNLRFLSNVSFIHSEVDIPDFELSVIQPLNSEFGTTRPFQGQSDILLNAALNYQDADLGLDAILAFNYFSERLAAVSQRGTPDIYEQPRPQLDFTLQKKFGDHYSIKLRVQNILDTNFRQTMTYKGVDYVVQENPRGITYGLGFSYTL